MKRHWISFFGLLLLHTTPIAGIITPKAALPGDWNTTVSATVDNPDLNDNEPDPPGPTKGDGLPESWTRSSPLEVANFPPFGISETTFQPGGRLWQSLDNSFANAPGVPFIKEWGLTMRYRTVPVIDLGIRYENVPTINITYDPDPTMAGVTVDSFTLPATNNVWTTVRRWSTFFGDPMPDEEFRIIASNILPPVSPANPVVVVDSAKFETRYTKAAAPKGAVKKKAVGKGAINYAPGLNPQSGLLALADLAIDTLIDASGGTLDPSIDPLFGASASLSDFQVELVAEGGVYLRGGTYEINKGNDVYFRAEVPWLFVDDDAMEQFGANIFGRLINPEFLIGGSDWLDEFQLLYEQTALMPLLQIATDSPLESALLSDAVYSGQASVTATFAAEVPIPAIAWLLLAGGLPFAARSMRPTAGSAA